jgi:hypothetical protein
MHLYASTRELADHLHIAMRSRAVIEQAKGILMSQRRCDAAEAFNLLAAASQRSDRKLRDIAQAIVDGVAGSGLPAELSDAGDVDLPRTPRRGGGARLNGWWLPGLRPLTPGSARPGRRARPGHD